jgi:hypothetical protein
MAQVKDLLVLVARQVEETHKSVLQYHLFEEVGKEGEDLKDDRKIIVHINCTFCQINEDVPRSAASLSRLLSTLCCTMDNWVILES